MRYLTLLFIAFVFVGCHSKPSPKQKWLKDTLAELRKQTDFKPLPLDEAYEFLNKCYLPKLDSLQGEQKIGIYPIAGTDFEARYLAIKKRLESEDTISKPTLTPPAPMKVDSAFKWSATRLKKCTVVNDTITPRCEAIFSTLAQRKGATKDDKTLEYLHQKRISNRNDCIKEFHRLYGLGYVMISYPQYNVQTNRLIVRQWIEDKGWCGTGKDERYVFEKTASGWREL